MNISKIKNAIKTTKNIYPQIYAYTLPTQKEKDGWIKIGYTERKNVEERIKEQTQTAAIRLEYQKIWSESARYAKTGEWFTDHQYHDYLKRFKEIERQPKTEWFYYNQDYDESHRDYKDFINGKYNQSEGKVDYTLREEQMDAVNKTLDYFNRYKNSEFLWNAKPRFGKTLTTYDLARKMDAINVLVLTNRPAIANSWFDDFQKFIAWQTEYKFISTTDTLKNRPVLTINEFMESIDENSRQITFISLQDLKGALYFGGQYDKLAWVKDLQWDLLVIDEAHEGVDTLKTDVAFDNIQRKFTLHLSGTPFKAVASGKFKEEQIYNWSYADEQGMKAEWNNIEDNNPYDKLPQLNLLSYQMGQMITEEVNKGAQIDGENADFAFDLNEFFETKDNGKFVHEKEVIRWLDTLTKNEKYPFSTRELRDELKHTFWILNRVASAKALQKLLKDHPVFENYEIILAAGDGKHEEEDIINESSLKRVKDAISQNNKTITLSVGQLTTGITIPEWTAVMMLSNMKSPSLYMQAAFRSQNPWEYNEDGQIKQKRNVYVFDFAPERTLIIYDEFANNLSIKTSSAGGTSEDRKKNIKRLLNFFPVLAEDTEGQMIALDVNEVLTIPKAIKAQEVVKRGFMSNLLFQNISGIFASTEAREILEQLNPVDSGKKVPTRTEKEIETGDITLDENGEVTLDLELIIATTTARFGEKIYGGIVEDLELSLEDGATNLAQLAVKQFIDKTQGVTKELAKENGLTVKQADAVVKNNTDEIAREIEVIQKQADIERKEATVKYKRIIAEAAYDNVKMAEAEAAYEAKKVQLEAAFKQEILSTVETKSEEATQEITKTILSRSEEKKKNRVEDDVRARLRGFSRTIPSFLMAYGTHETNLSNFDTVITENVFQDVTGITLEQFRVLRDKHNFFDTIVFDEACQEFLKKRQELANYFDEEQDEDIFDYIPPQQTNQIYTPKKVVKMMVDKLEEETPNIFMDSSKTFADLYMKSGLYITEIVKRLYKGLENKIPNKEARLKHILENQVYGFAPTEIIYNIALNFVFGFDENVENIDNTHIVCLDTTSFARGEGDFEKKCEELFGGMKL